jgi:hypothetical protein
MPKAHSRDLRVRVIETIEAGGRNVTTRHIPPEHSLAVGMPSTSAPDGWRWSLLADIVRLESGHTPNEAPPQTDEVYQLARVV